MAISETQLSTWSHQGSITNSAATANAIKDVIKSHNLFPSGIAFDVYLSGSYKNDTNIYGESDVDVVVELTSTFYNNLSEDQKAYFGFTSATYGCPEFKADVIKCLVKSFGSSLITVGNKAIKVYPPYNNRLHADVLVCSTYRRYATLNDANTYYGGIGFFRNDDGQFITNYPKLHSYNDTSKHQNTGGYFKPAIRIIKNIRSRLIDNGVIDKKLAPSYFVECFLYNVPDVYFGKDYQSTILNILTYLNNNSWDHFKCVNGITPLWGTTAETWSASSARKFLTEVINKWNNP